MNPENRVKIAIALVSALAGGATNSVIESANTAGRLTAIERAVQRIELRLDQVTSTPPKPSTDRN